MADMSGRVAVVTGGGTGIGRAVALRLSRAGAKVALLARSRERLEKVAAEAPGIRRAVRARARPTSTT